MGTAEGTPRGRPHPALRSVVREYVGYRHVGDLPPVHHGVSGPSATVIVAFDEPLDVGWAGTPERRDRHWVMVSGLHTAPALIHTHDHLHGIQLDLTPLGVRRLLGAPSASLAGHIVDHADAPLGLTPAVHAALAHAGSWAERYALLDRVLVAALARHERAGGRVHPAAYDGWRHLAATHGRVGVGDLARLTGWSRRHLGARFVAEFGVTPKEAGRLLRFALARRLVGAGAPLASAAALAGYADQPHLTREWTALAGQPPLATLAESRAFVQDDEGPRRRA